MNGSIQGKQNSFLFPAAACFCTATILASCLLPAAVQAQSILPANDGTNTLINQTGNQFDISGGTRSRNGENLFQSFQRLGLDAGQVANFLATPDLRNILGRVTGGEASLINGVIQVTGSNANLFLMNPAGIVFGANASLNVPAAFTATTANGIGIGNGWFSATGGNDYGLLNGTPDLLAFTVSQPGAIANFGTLAVSTGQTLALVGGSVLNTGQLTAPGGQLAIAAAPGQTLVRLSQADRLLSFEFYPLSSSPTLPADWTLPITTLPQLLTGSNATNANAVTVNPDGTVQLSGSGLRVPTDTGTVILSGGINAACQTSGCVGGGVTVVGDRVALLQTNLDASGTQGGGTVRLGGNYQGQGTLPRASQVFVDRNSTLRVDATQRGDGGQVILWSDQATQFQGQISAKGGSQGGNGGQVEVSSLGNLGVQGSIDVSATTGRSGSVLFDPRNITIINATGAAEDSRIVGGTIFQAEGGAVDFTISSTALSALTGNITLQASGDIILTTNLALTGTPGTTISFTAQGNFSGAGQTITAPRRNVVIDAAGIAIGTIDTGSNTGLDNTNAGSINLTARSGDIQATNLRAISQLTVFLGTVGSVGSGGDAILSAAGNISVATVSTDSFLFNSGGTGRSGTAGRVDLQANGNVTVSTGVSATSSGISGSSNGGNVSIGSTTGTLDIARVTTATSTTEPPIAPLGNGGSIDLRARQQIATGSLVSSAVGGNGGDVNLVTQSNARVDSINAQGGTSGTGGTVNVSTASGLRVTGSFSDRNGNTASISTAGGVQGGNLTLRPVGTAPFIIGDATTNGTVAGLTTSATNRVNPSRTIQGTLTQGTAPGQIQVITTNTNPNPNPRNPIPRNPNNPNPNNPDPNNPDPNNPESSDISSECFVCKFKPLINSPTVQDTTLATGPMLGTFESSWTDEFKNYLEPDLVAREPVAREINLAEAQAILTRVGTTTGAKPALLYVRFAPQPTLKPDRTSVDRRSSVTVVNEEQLEILLVTDSGEPLRLAVPVARNQVLKVAQRFRNAVADPSQTFTRSYLRDGQQLYRWLIAPIEAVLQQRDIQTVAFVMDSGLRFIPLAALHDGQRFLVEKYSVGLMPSLSLTDTRIADLKGSTILAAGASQFAEQTALPAVPLELASIKTRWQGRSLLNEDFTLDNLRRQRQLQPFGIVHLATHGEFRPGAVGQSYIQLSDRRLRLNQLRQLGWNDPPVNLLVLSACRMALGNDEAEQGFAELGFASLALQAGVKTALASLWSVSDDGTSGLMAEFYEQLYRSPLKAEALRRTQISMLKGNVRIEGGKLVWSGGSADLPPELADLGDRPLTHPYYWSAFTMIGSPW